MSPSNPARCAACPVKDGPWCAAATHPRYCQLAAKGDKHYLARIVQRSTAGPVPPPAPRPKPPEPPPPPAIPSILPPIGEWSLVKTAQLTRDAATLAANLPPDVDLVVAIPRSGLVPAAIVAFAIHRPLWTVSVSEGVNDPGHGGRLASGPPEPFRHIVVIDDSAASGREMARCAPIVADRFPGAKITRAVVYAHPSAWRSVDLCVSVYGGRHFLEWNWPNSGHAERIAFDFDGVLTPDRDRDQRPLFLPRRKPIPLIVTGRGERHRASSLAWLERQGATVERLEMRPFPLTDARPHHVQIAEWKASVYAASDCTLFAESDRAQSEIIARRTGKAVLCVDAGTIYPPISGRDRAAKCPDRGCKTGCQHAICNRYHTEVHMSECIRCVTEEVPPCRAGAKIQ